MIKFTADQGNGRTLLGIGLSFATDALPPRREDEEPDE